MTYRKLLVLYSVCLLAYFVLASRIFLIASNIKYADAAHGQTITTLQLDQERGNFYDCNGMALTGLYDSWNALCIPGEESYANLYDYVSDEAQTVLYQNRNRTVPFLIEVEQDLTEQGIYTTHSVERYAAVPIATHLIGYTNQDGVGVSGLEAALDQSLCGVGEQGYLQCITTAEGKLMDETAPILCDSNIECSDVKLTLEKEIQRIAEGTASVMMEQGAIVILEAETAKVRASVSVPTYDPNDVAASLSSENGALLNRAFCAYSVGSVFKPVLAAAAMEQGLDWYSTTCKGYVDVNGQIYRCANGVAHGEVNLNTALEQSCNCYFIELGQILGAQTIAEYSEKFGFGQATLIADGWHTATGNMPKEARLENIGQLANVSFGQGELLATPLQIAAMMNTIVNGGSYLEPSYIEGYGSTDAVGNLRLTQSSSHPQRETVLTQSTAAQMQSSLVAVVEEGIAGAAKPEDGSAGGKTGTAQTGRYHVDGTEYKNLWFAGFYPAENPQYTIVVMQDDQISAAHSSAEIFAKICDEIALLSCEDNEEKLEVDIEKGEENKESA